MKGNQSDERRVPRIKVFTQVTSSSISQVLLHNLLFTLFFPAMALITAHNQSVFVNSSQIVINKNTGTLSILLTPSLQHQTQQALDTSLFIHSTNAY